VLPSATLCSRSKINCRVGLFRHPLANFKCKEINHFTLGEPHKTSERWWLSACKGIIQHPIKHLNQTTYLELNDLIFFNNLDTHNNVGGLCGERIAVCIIEV